MDPEIQLKGFEEVNRMLLQFPNKIARNILRKGVQAGAGVFRKELRQAAPIRQTGGPKKMSKGGSRTSGFLKKNIKARYNRKRSRFNDVHYIVGPSGQAFYGYIVARGHIVGSRRAAKFKKLTGRGKSVKRVEAHDFITPAFWRAYNAALDKTRTALNQGINREALKIGFKSMARP